MPEEATPTLTTGKAHLRDGDAVIHERIEALLPEASIFSLERWGLERHKVVLSTLPMV